MTNDSTTESLNGMQAAFALSHNRMRIVVSEFVKKYPALSLFLVALVFGPALVAPVLAGLLSPQFLQLGALSASLAGFVVAALEGGRPSMRELLQRGIIWRVGIKWWLVAVLLPAAPAFGAMCLGGVYTNRTIEWSSLDPLYSIIPSMLLLVVFAGLGEEFGWRGFAFPRLCVRNNAVQSALIIGGLRALWHIPLFLVEGEAYNAMARQIGFFPAFLGYGCLVVALSIQLSWIVSNTRGSVLLASVYHGASNSWAGYIGIDRAELSSQFAFVVAHVVVAVLIVFFFDWQTLSRAQTLYRCLVTRKSVGIHSVDQGT